MKFIRNLKINYLFNTKNLLNKIYQKFNKNNVIMLITIYFILFNIWLPWILSQFLITGFQRLREKSNSKTMRCIRGSAWDYQGLFPCWWKWSKENILRQINRIKIIELCLVSIHTNNRCFGQDICYDSNKSR